MSTLSFTAILNERSQTGRQPAGARATRPKMDVRGLSF